ncbi:DUF805 domain-containing protein [Deltaproteobacteria bacterium OttesenSCG-928-K17]|nr:DUF805 domain-containing protein [Deltaproteobacteria bacterium OttesenSCG-928-K17]
MQAFQEYFLNILKYKYYQPTGRARRKEFWMFYLFFFLILVGLLIVTAILGAISDTLGMLFSLVIALAYLGLIVPIVCLQIRRLHDIGKSGWWSLLGYIPIINSIGGIVILVFDCMDSQPGENMYGPNPKGM